MLAIPDDLSDLSAHLESVNGYLKKCDNVAPAFALRMLIAALEACGHDLTSTHFWQELEPWKFRYLVRGEGRSRAGLDGVFGIDLGTTYSAVAHIDDLNQVEIIKNLSGEDTTPSVVYFESGAAIVGAEAKSCLVTDPDNGCALIKRHMGTVFPQEFDGQTYTPESISGLILKELVHAANQEGESKVTKAVITVPAYFGVREKEATKQAGEMAGLEVVGILAEPVAALLSVGIPEERETVLIYDLGGGTFDTTVMIAEPGNVEVVAVDGNRVLGGADWDAALARVVIDKFVAQAGIADVDPADDPDFMVEILQDVESKKKLLTRKQDITFRCRFEGHDEKILVTRDEFAVATAHLVQQTVGITRRVIDFAKCKSPGLVIDKLLLAGGSSRMPMVAEALRAAGFDPIPTDFDLAAAKGAAIYGRVVLSGAGKLERGSRAGTSTNTGVADILGPSAATLSVKNVLLRNIGVEFVREVVAGGLVRYANFVVHAGQSLPLEDTFEVVSNSHQNKLRVRVYERSDGSRFGNFDLDLVLKDVEVNEMSIPCGCAIQLRVIISVTGLATIAVQQGHEVAFSLQTRVGADAT
ncbi:Hsp70 family protein [Antrihabitans sp. NCIMB 15450]|uniref:Hsp70 family protein n=1 Tax=Antrihabitans spumae TaxID=3373370 RepID=A0ABW7K775_9NOCA